MMKWISIAVTILYLVLIPLVFTNWLRTGHTIDLAQTILFVVAFVMWAALAWVRWRA